MKKQIVERGGQLYGRFSWEVYKVMEHYELYVNGEFWSSGDNRREIEEELEALIQNPPGA